MNANIKFIRMVAEFEIPDEDSSHYRVAKIKPFVWAERENNFVIMRNTTFCDQYFITREEAILELKKLKGVYEERSYKKIEIKWGQHVE